MLSYWFSFYFLSALQLQYLSFDAQIDAFEKVKEGIKAKIGAAGAEKLSNEALYLIGLGIQNLFFIHFYVRKKIHQLKGTHDTSIILVKKCTNKEILTSTKITTVTFLEKFWILSLIKHFLCLFSFFFLDLLCRKQWLCKQLHEAFHGRWRSLHSWWICSSLDQSIKPTIQGISLPYS